MDDRNPNVEDLQKDLKIWSIRQNVNHSQLDSLLKVLQKYHPTFSQCSKTILQTVRNFDSTTMVDSVGKTSSYIYFGIEKGLKAQFDMGIGHILRKLGVSELELVCNVDGLPIYNSSNKQFWPILGKIFLKGFRTRPFTIALFEGVSKPKDLDAFLHNFIQECNYLHTNGFSLSECKYAFRLKYLICDALARSYIKSIKPHNSYFGCEKCHIKGERINNRVLFIDTGKNVLRTDERFRLQLNIEHHMGVSPLVKINDFDIVNGMPLDTMHLAYLGVMRRLLNYWVKLKISPTYRKKISHRLLQIADVFPKEFNRKPVSIENLDRWKATQFRLFLIYVGPFVLSGLLSNNMYKHFMLLHCSFRIASCEKFTDLKDVALRMISDCSNLFP